MNTEALYGAGATEEKGEIARLASFVGAIAIADLVKTTLGPKGMDKILQSMSAGESITITNDGATILKSIHTDNPAAKVLVELSKTQDDEVGDGTTSGTRPAPDAPAGEGLGGTDGPRPRAQWWCWRGSCSGRRRSW